MADTQDKPVIKGVRRASFARALHVPAIGRRKPFQIAEDTHRTSSPSQEHADNSPQRLSTPQHLSSPQRLSSPQQDSFSIESPRVGNHDDEGAAIPDIPLRRLPNTNRSDIDYSGSRLAMLEQILAEGGSQELLNDHQSGPINPNSVASRGSSRYGAQLTAFWEPPHLSQSKDSRERSLPNGPETPPPPSTMRGASPEFLAAPLLPPWRESHSAPPSTAGSVVSSQDTLSQSTYRRGSQDTMSQSTYRRGSHDRATIGSSIASVSLQTDLALPALQTKGADEIGDALEPVAEEDVEPGSFDLVVPATNIAMYNLERRSELLFSVDHLRVIFDDPILLHRFTNFVNTYRPRSVPLLRYYLDALKAIRAMEWINSTISNRLHLDGHDFSANGPPKSTENESLRGVSEAAFEALARHELPAYITHVWTEIVEMSMKRRITGTLPAHLRHMSDGLAEVFCITDPSRPDNPIVFTSEEFNRTTQYGLDYVIGRNCRFLQGPKTNPFSVKRIRDNLEQGKVHSETFLNYRRDGSPFMNLLMCAPLMDSKGKVRYFLGAQVDVSGLAKGCSGLESLRRLVDQNDEDQNRLFPAQGPQESLTDDRPKQDSGADGSNGGATSVGTAAAASTVKQAPGSGENEEDDFRLLCETFNGQELETARRFGGRMHRSQQEQVQHLETVSNWNKRRVVIHDSSEDSPPPTSRQQYNGTDSYGFNGDFTPASPRAPASATSPPPQAASAATAGLRGTRVPAIYENYLIVRPYPSLRILFASPSLRVPGILQSHLMSRVGGSRRVQEELEQAFAMGQGVTAKVKWVSGGARGDAGKEGRPRWIHCTPLIGSNGGVGVWMVVIVDEDEPGGAEQPDEGGGRRQRRDVSSPAFNGKGGGGGGGRHRSSDRRREHRDSSLWDSMSLNDFAAMNSLPEDEELRQHVREMFGDVRRRERAARGERGGKDVRYDDPRARTNGGSDMVGYRAADLRRWDRAGSSAGGSRASSPYTLRVGELP